MVKKKNIRQKRSPWYVKSWNKVLFLLILGSFILLGPGQNSYFYITEKPSGVLKRLPFAVPSPAPYPVNATGVMPGSDITAGGIVILDVASGVYLYKRNELSELSPASTTKIMTALVALDAYNLDDVLTVKTLANSGQTMNLVPGERMTMENLLYGALVYSANDAAYVLADNYPGGVDKFVEAMNQKAQTLHLTGSHYTNPVGYDDPQHKMTPIDLSRLSTVALTNKTIAKIVAIPQITISDVTHTYFHALTNVNQLLGKIPGVGGIKTGWTEEAGENLVTLIERNGHRVTIVLLHSKDRFGETSKLIEWIFGNFSWESFVPVS